LVKQQHLLILRFSALGDVAMTVPVIRLLLKQYPNLKVTLVSTNFVKPLFEGIERLQFHSANFKAQHKGLLGLYKLYKELRGHKIDAIADLHNVIRSIIVRRFFFSKETAVIDKGRKEKKELTREHNKKLRPLKSTFQRYADVFADLGYPLVLNVEEGQKEKTFHEEASKWKAEGYSLIGIAPFALHREKVYPAEKMKEVLRLLNQQEGMKIFLLGGKDDAKQLEDWCNEFSHVESIAGKMDFQSELAFISNLDVMVSMDSANMHLASLYGVPVGSIWGGTHPSLGFYGWGQDLSNVVQIDLECRPSSVFGNRPCKNDLACMNGISPIMVFDKIMQQLQKNKA